MYRTQISTFLLASVVLVSAAGISHGQTLTVLEEHSVQCDVSSMLTNWESTCQIPLYDPADHSGSLLDSVMVTLVGSARSTVDVTASTDTTLNPSVLPPGTVNPAGRVGAVVSAAWDVGGTALSLSAFPESPIANSQDILIAADQMTTLTDLSGTDDTVLTTNGIANTDIYLGDGTFDVTLGADGYGQNPFASGGNLTLTQETQASAQLIVQYKTFEPLPEPAAGFMAAFGFIGALGMRRRRG